MKKKLFLIINFIFITAIIILETKYHHLLTDFDIKVSEYVWSIRTPILTNIMNAISFLASFPFIVIVLLTIIIIKRDIYFPLAMSLSSILNYILKIIFKRVRPSNIIVIEKGFSFPSGHAMGAMSFYGYIIYKVFNSNINKKLKWIYISLLIFLIILIGFSRIYLGAHYLSDIICGYLISVEFLILYTSIIKK